MVFLHRLQMTLPKQRKSHTSNSKSVNYVVITYSVKDCLGSFRLIGDLIIFTSNFDDSSQFLKTIFPDYLHTIKTHTFS